MKLRMYLFRQVHSGKKSVLRREANTCTRIICTCILAVLVHAYSTFIAWCILIHVFSHMIEPLQGNARAPCYLTKLKRSANTTLHDFSLFLRFSFSNSLLHGEVNK
jgi:hypothetical protein